MHHSKIAFLGALLLAGASLFAQPGTPDPAFGNKGFSQTNVYRSDDQAFGAARRPDGRLLIAGSAVRNASKVFAAVQLLPDGNPDPSFDLDGILLRSVGPAEAVAYAVALYPDGKAVLGGNVIYSFSEKDFGLLRLLPDGSRDADFGDNGTVITDFNGGDEFLDAVLIQPDRKIVAAGSTAQPFAEANVALARYLPDGTPDSTFGVDGKVEHSFSPASDVTYDALLLPDGNILVAGQYYYNDISSDYLIARFLENGRLDSTFADNGFIRIDFGAFTDLCRGVTLQTDEKIVVAGFSVFDDFITRVSVARLLPDGTPDTSFGNQGKVVRQIGVYSTLATDVQVQTDGKILISGMTEDTDQRDFFVYRLLPNGDPDPDFGTAGVLVHSVSDKDDNAYELVLEPDGSATLVGRSENQNEADITALRITPDGAPDLAYQTNGARRIDLGNSYDDVYDLQVLPDGGLILAGSALVAPTFSGNVNAVLAAYTPEGAPDPAFGNQGLVRNDYSPTWDIWTALARQDGGKLLAAGAIGQQPGLARFLAGGIPDSSFGVNGRLTVLAGPVSSFSALLSQPDGCILAAGDPGQIQVENLLRRFLPDGTVDTGFGQNGVAPGPLPQSKVIWHDLALTPEGNILACGTWSSFDLPQTSGSIVARYRPDGSLDADFGQQGLLLFDGASTTLPGLAISTIARQNDGKILLGGSNGDFVLLRLLANGDPDPDFGTDGIFTLDVDGVDNLVNDLLLQPDGRILAAGWNRGPAGYTGDPFVVARLDPGGTPDPTFADNGIFHYPAQAARALGLQPDGSILVGGNLPLGTNRNDFILIRLLSGPALGIADDGALPLAVHVYPNPVAEHMSLDYALRQDQHVSIRLHDPSGRMVSVLLNRVHRPAGSHRESLSLPPDLAPGLYTLAVETQNGSKSMKIIKL